MRLREQENPDERPEPAAHVGEEEIEPIESVETHDGDDPCELAGERRRGQTPGQGIIDVSEPALLG
ncbi:hypothetical protein MSC49_06030 [Methylosinus sp. C49]|nr:hypothetical protein MSC49_06030 [Methylosinus sp. C49]